MNGGVTSALGSCVCLVCGNRTHELVNLHQNQEMTKMLIGSGLPSQSFDEEAAFVCVQCILKIKLFQEKTIKTKEKMKRTMRSTISTSSKLEGSNISAKKSIFSCAKVVRRKVHSSPSSTSGCRNTKRTKATTPPESVPDVHTVCMPTSTENTADLLFSGPPVSVQRENSLSRCSNDLATLPDSATKSPPTAPIAPATLQDLEDTENLKLKERPSPNLDQRNGTHISGFSVSRSPSPSTQNPSMLDVFYERKEPVLVTESGGKVNKYDKLEDPHVVRSTPQQFICKLCERIYKRKHFYTKHMRRCRPKAKTLDRPKTTKPGVLSDVEGTSRKLVFHCNVCPVTVENQTKLRKHKLIHLSRLYCPTCGNEFNALQDYEFHCVQCLAKQLNAAIELRSSLMRPITRSQSRAASIAATHLAKSCVSITCSKRAREDDEAKDDTYGDADYVEYDNYGDVDDDDDDDDRDDAVSVADTMYTKRMRYTDHWVEDHSKRANNNMFLGSLDEEYLQISSNKEYDLYLLDRLKMDIMLQSFPCYVPSCRFRGESHFKLMMHEFCDHAQKLLFHCKKCGNNFTRKVHLDFHLYCQNGGRYICFKCGDVFEFQDQLDRHLIRHTKSVNYRCNFCKFEFLTKGELLEHCGLENHDANGERKLISIVPSMTIVNPMPPPKPSESRRQYKEHIMIMHLPKIPHNTSLHKHFRRRPQVGDVQFKGQMHPNCSSCIFYV